MIFRQRLFFKPKLERVTQWVDYHTLFLTLQGWAPLNCYPDIFHTSVGNGGFTSPLINQSGLHLQPWFVTTHAEEQVWKVTFLCSHPYFYLQNSNIDFNFDSLRIIQLETIQLE